MYLDTLKVNDSVERHSYYPYNVLQKLERPNIDFSGITILYGSNGSGKSTLLNLIANKIECKRFAEYVENEMWVGEQSPINGSWTNRKVYPITEASSTIDISMFSTNYLTKQIITMDDILKTIDAEKEFNHYMVDKADSIQEEAREFRRSSYRSLYDENGRFDLEKLTAMREAKRKTTSLKKYVDKRIEDRKDVNSNGETVLKFYRENLGIRGIYLLDEPENCLSTSYQLKLKELIEIANQTKDCQFIIATHSPIFLALADARVYNLDIIPVEVTEWYKLENVKAYYNFFQENSKYFMKKESEYLSDIEYDYLVMWFDYNGGIEYFFKLNYDEQLLKQAYLIHTQNKKLKPNEIIDTLFNNK